MGDNSEITHLFFQKARSRLALISATRFMALMVVWTNSLLYLTGTFRRFSNSNVESYERGEGFVSEYCRKDSQ
jgi:ATP/ADP translocase